MNSVLTSLAFMYVTLMPVIFAGIFNMVFCKLPILGFLKKPMDAGKNFTDGRRIFGDNKTWKGFAGYLILGTLMTLIWGFICKAAPALQSHDFFYLEHENTVTFNLLTGLLIGFAYALFELPNSFLKRRLGIEPGKTMKGWMDNPTLAMRTATPRTAYRCRASLVPPSGLMRTMAVFPHMCHPHPPATGQPFMAMFPTHPALKKEITNSQTPS